MNVPGAVQPLLQEADQLLGEAARRGLVLRLAVSAGVLRNCDNCRDVATPACGRG